MWIISGPSGRFACAVVFDRRRDDARPPTAPDIHVAAVPTSPLPSSPWVSSLSEEAPTSDPSRALPPKEGEARTCAAVAPHRHLESWMEGIPPPLDPSAASLAR